MSDMKAWRDIKDIHSDKDKDKDNLTADITVGHIFSPAVAAAEARTPSNQNTSTNALHAYHIPEIIHQA